MNMTSTDWNWFFAAFAQCAAALIGIIGAFIISKILNESSRQEEFSSKAKDFFIDFDNTSNRIQYLPFDWYDKNTVKYSSEVENAIRNGGFKGLSDEQIRKKLTEEIEPTLNGTDTCVAELKKRKRQFSAHGGSPLLLPFPPKGIWDKLKEEKDRINALRIESITLTHRFNRLKSENSSAKANLKTIRNTIWFLIIGFILTVIYPLGLMPLQIGQIPDLKLDIGVIIDNAFSTRGMFLFLLTAVVLGIFIYFLNISHGIKKAYKKTDEELKPEFGGLKEYSKYF